MKQIIILSFLAVFVTAGLAAAEQHKFQFDQKALEKAYKLVDHQKYKQALKILEKLVPYDEDIINLNPETDRTDRIVLSDVYFNIGFSYGKLGDDAKLLDYYNKALNVFPENQAALYDLAKYYRAKGEDPIAEDLLKRLININITHDWAFLMLAQICEQKGDFTKAKDYYKEAARLGNEEAARKLNEDANKPE